MTSVLVTGVFDNFRSRHVRLLHEASRLGSVRVLLWSDSAARSLLGPTPAFPEEERAYTVEALRFVDTVQVWNGEISPEGMPLIADVPEKTWVVPMDEETAQDEDFCLQHDLDYHPLEPDSLQGFPLEPVSFEAARRSSVKRVIVSGCYDWFHSGHVRFFEEAAEYGDLYVSVGSDANIRLLKGNEHPMFPEEERLYMVQAVRHVRGAMIGSGHGWMDAEPEIEKIGPHYYVVNEEGDRPEKREYCGKHGMEYVVLRRNPREGLPRRRSTVLRGF
jgi:cytidyltransferase-like protein